MIPDDYALLIEDSASTTDLAVVDLPPGCTVVDAADALEAVFATDPDTPAVLVVVGEEVIGVSTRKRLRELGSAVVRSLGDGDGATLPGASLRYRILSFSCPTCRARIRRIHVDPRTPPGCPNGHGPMALEP